MTRTELILAIQTGLLVIIGVCAFAGIAQTTRAIWRGQ